VLKIGTILDHFGAVQPLITLLHHAKIHLNCKKSKPSPKNLKLGISLTCGVYKDEKIKKHTTPKCMRAVET
jgi:hypothetical protein